MVKVNKITKSEPNGWNKVKKMSNNAYARFLNGYRSKDFIDKEDSFILDYIDEKYFNRYEVHHIEENNTITIDKVYPILHILKILRVKYSKINDKDKIKRINKYIDKINNEIKLDSDKKSIYSKENINWAIGIFPDANIDFSAYSDYQDSLIINRAKFSELVKYVSSYKLQRILYRINFNAPIFVNDIPSILVNIDKFYSNKNKTLLPKEIAIDQLINENDQNNEIINLDGYSNLGQINNNINDDNNLSKNNYSINQKIIKIRDIKNDYQDKNYLKLLQVYLSSYDKLNKILDKILLKQEGVVFLFSFYSFYSFDDNKKDIHLTIESYNNNQIKKIKSYLLRKIRSINKKEGFNFKISSRKNKDLKYFNLKSSPLFTNYKYRFNHNKIIFINVSINKNLYLNDELKIDIEKDYKLYTLFNIFVEDLKKIKIDQIAK